MTIPPDTQMPPLPEVAVLHRDQDGTFYLEYEGDAQLYEVAMLNSPLSKAIDAYAQAHAAQECAALKARLAVADARVALELRQRFPGAWQAGFEGRPLADCPVDELQAYLAGRDAASIKATP